MVEGNVILFVCEIISRDVYEYLFIEFMNNESVRSCLLAERRFCLTFDPDSVLLCFRAFPCFHFKSVRIEFDVIQVSVFRSCCQSISRCGLLSLKNDIRTNEQKLARCSFRQ